MDLTNNIKASDYYNNPCVIFSNGIGDHFLVLPCLRALSKLFNGNLILICEKYSYARDIFHGVKLKEIVGIRFWEEDIGRRFDARKLLKKIKHCDLLISLNPWGDDLDINYLLENLELKDSVGFYKNFTKQIYFNLDKHNFDLNFDIAKSINSSLKIEDYNNPPKIGENFDLLRERFLKFKNENIKLLALHTDTKEDKMWCDDYFIEVLERLCFEFPNVGIVVVGEKKINLEQNNLRDRVLSFSETALPFRIACAMVSISDFFLGVDSVFLHVADLYRVPAIGLFGPTSKIEFGSRFNLNQDMQAQSNTMSNIKPSEVIENLSKLILNTT